MNNILIGILILCGTGGILALLLELAHSLIADYGECRILINGQKRILVKGGLSLLFSLQEQGIFVPSACGGKGTCAYCKVDVLEGGGPVLPTELPYLSGEETQSGTRLSCQVKVRNDLKIKIPEELFAVKEFRVKTERIDLMTSFIKRYIFRITDPSEGITFKPGQYVQLEIPAYKKSKTPEYRAYSLASASAEPQTVEILVTKADRGIVSGYLHEYLEQGEELVMRGPFGDFFYHESDVEMLLIATGSGLAPMMSILRHIRQKKIDRKITLFFGSRTPDDIFYREELAQLRKTLNDFRFIPVLSRTTEEQGWSGEKGHVTDLIRKYVPDNAQMDVYICGSAPMVDDSLELLQSKGIAADHIYFDKFDS